QMSFAQFTRAFAVPGTKRGKQSSFLLDSNGRALRSRKGDASQPGHARAHRIQLSSQQGIARRFSQDIVIELKLLAMAHPVAATLRFRHCIDGGGQAVELLGGHSLGGSEGGNSFQRGAYLVEFANFLRRHTDDDRTTIGKDANPSLSLELAK